MSEVILFNSYDAQFMKILYRYWLRNNVDEGKFAKTKFRINLVFIILCAFTSIGYWIAAPIIQFNVPRLVFLVLAIALILEGTLLITRKISTSVIGQLFIATCGAAFIVGSYYSGGIHSIVLPWMALLPVMANLMLDYRKSIAWFVISVSCVAAFSLLHENMPELQFTEGPWRVIISIAGLCFTLFFFTSLFDRARYKMMHVVDKRNAQLKERQKEILLQKDEIKKQMGDIRLINGRLEDKINEIDSRNKILELHWNTLLDLSKNKTISFGSMDESIQCILKVTAESLHLNRVSIWQYHHDPKRIECLAVYDAEKDVFKKELDLAENLNPSYFKSILNEKVIAVNNVHQHEATAGFVDTYLTPNQIFSMMDAPYFIDGKLAGVLCCESRFERHVWSCEDMIFATSMADIIALAYRCSMRNEYERNVREMNRKISMQNEMLVQKSEEIEKINQSLEQRVSKRTEELMVRNMQLTEYAFINSHSLRGPVARVMGLAELMEREGSKLDLDDFIKRLKESSSELDGVVRKITDAIDSGTHFSRENFV